MVEYSAKHYQIKSEKSAVRAEDAANRAEEYANSLEPETFVKTSGNQTWTGVKTAKHANIQVQCSVADDTATSITSNEERGLLIVDKDGARIGNFFSGQITDGKIRTYMCSARNVSGTMKYQYAEIRQNVDGTGNFNIACTSATSPTPATSDNSTKIATTAWVNNKKADIVSWGCPNYSAGVGFTFNASTSYKAPKDGFIFIYTGRDNDQSSNIKINGTQVGYSIAYWTNIQYFFPVCKGDVISTGYSTFSSARFYPLKGAN